MSLSVVSFVPGSEKTRKLWTTWSKRPHQRWLAALSLSLNLCWFGGRVVRHGHDSQIPSKTWAAPSFRMYHAIFMPFQVLGAAGGRDAKDSFELQVSAVCILAPAAQPSRRSKKITKWREVNADCPQSMGMHHKSPVAGSSREKNWKRSLEHAVQHFSCTRAPPVQESWQLD